MSFKSILSVLSFFLTELIVFGYKCNRIFFRIYFLPGFSFGGQILVFLVVVFGILQPFSRSFMDRF